MRLQRGYRHPSELGGVQAIASGTAAEHTVGFRETMPKRREHGLETLDQPYVHRGARRLSQHRERGRERALGRHHVRDERPRHRVADEAGVRLVSEVVSGMLGLAHAADDAHHPQVRNARSERVGIEAEPRKGRRTLTR